MFSLTSREGGKVLLSTQHLTMKNRGESDRVLQRRRPEGKKVMLWCAQVV